MVGGDLGWFGIYQREEGLGEGDLCHLECLKSL